ncbi:hypothetical protein [Ferrimonas gelatinilytica]|uniref:Uncharacterized protein n=1 Tax=Ferrimonas gelatinilytica TaxID=1255257 RepID=A0ABP9RWR7_9GAMM
MSKSEKKQYGKVDKQHQKALKQLFKSLAKELAQQIPSQANDQAPSLTKAQRKALAKQWATQYLGQSDNVIPLYQDTALDFDRPLKEKPCKGCPALDKGLCRCAVKRARKAQPERNSAILVNA